MGISEVLEGKTSWQAMEIATKRVNQTLGEGINPSVLGSNPRGPTTYFDSGIAEISSPAERGSCVLTAVLTATSMDFLGR